MFKFLKIWKRCFVPSVIGWDDALYAGAMAATSAYTANQANSTSAGNSWTANLTNMVMQAQNQDWNASQAGLARDFNQREAAAARAFNAEQADKNRDWSQTMSSTAYQRAVEDMKAAGLNPMLAYSQGGAQNPSGGAATAQAISGPSASSSSAPRAEVPNVVRPDLVGAVNSAMDVQRKDAEVKQIEANTDLIKSQTNQTNLTSANIDQQFNVIRETISNIREDTRLKGMQGNTEQYRSYVQSYVSEQWHKMNDLEVKYKNYEIGLIS